MKRFICEIAVFTLIVTTAAALCLFCVVYMIPSYFSNDYLAIANVKYRQLKTTDSPRIILLGGSSLAFGLDQYLLSERVGIPVVNLGVHADLGLPLSVEIIKHYLREGDIVIAAPEYPAAESMPNPELLINASLDWEYLSCFVRSEYCTYDALFRYMLSYTPSYMIKKVHLFCRFGIRGVKEEISPLKSPYQFAAFDDNGQMTFPRPGREQSSPKLSSVVSIDISGDRVSYLNAFNEFVLDKGATLLFSFPPVFDECVATSSEDIDKAQRYAEENFAFPVISRIREYIFAANLMYDTSYHCSGIGAIRRTELLANDINNYRSSVK